MALYTKTLNIKGEVYNLTGEVLNVYTTEGSIITLKPKQHEITDKGYFIVNEKIDDPTDNILFVREKGEGWGGIEVATLCQLKNPKIRAYVVRGVS